MAIKHTPFPWENSGIEENAGYDCMFSAITVGPITLDGQEYGQEPCLPLTDEQRERMEADACLIQGIPDMLQTLRVIAIGTGAEASAEEAEDCRRAAQNVVNKVEGRRTGRAAYEADVEERPNYPDGSPRKPWNELGNLEKWSWERDSTS